MKEQNNTQRDHSGNCTVHPNYIDRIDLMRAAISSFNIDGYILCSNDEFQNEYVPENRNRLKWLTGFTGSNGVLIITQRSLLFFTDSRYLLQAEIELNHQHLSKLSNVVLSNDLSKDLSNVDKKVILHDTHNLQNSHENYKDQYYKYKILNIHLASSCNVLKEEILNNKIKFIGYNPMLHSVNNFQYYDKLSRNMGFKMTPIQKDFIWHLAHHGKNFNSPSREFLDTSIAFETKDDNIVLDDVYVLEDQYAGMTTHDKIKNILNLISKEADFLFITSPQSICWLLNIRAQDLRHIPVLLCYAILNTKNCEIDLFVSNKSSLQYFFEKSTIFDLYKHKKNTISFSKENIALYNHLKCNNVTLYKFDDLIPSILNLIHKDQYIEIDSSTMPIMFKNMLRNEQLKFFIAAEDPCLILRAKKNHIEIYGFKKAHVYDGIAMMKFLAWVYHKIDNEIEFTELEASDHLLSLRMEQPLFKCLSFDTISAYAENASIIHYKPTVFSNKIINSSKVFIPSNNINNNKISDNINTNNNANYTIPLYLCDSGGNYMCGTTDITRTINTRSIHSIYHGYNDIDVHYKEKEIEYKRNFTAVLKGHIMLAMTKFPLGTTGGQLDAIARFYLWQLGLDFGHGTGHGVGHFMSVHEGPHGISKGSKVVLEKNMIVSIEPGFYKDNEYGIRIENLYVIKEAVLDMDQDLSNWHMNNTDIMQKSNKDYNKNNDDGIDDNNGNNGNNNEIKFLEFEPLSVVSIDMTLVNFEELDKMHKNWLIKYMKNIENIIFPHLTKSEREILLKRSFTSL